MLDCTHNLFAITVTFFVLSWITVSLRIYCRLWVIRSFGTDDKLMIILLGVFTVYSVSLLMCILRGGESERQGLMFYYFCEIIYIISASLLKLSVGYMLLRIATVSRHVWMLRLMIISTVIFGLAFFIVATFQCMPPSVFWNEAPLTRGKCFSDTVLMVMTFSASGLNCVADWTFCTIPIFVVWSLSLPTRSKILVVCIMGFAAIGSAATIVRAVYIPTLLIRVEFLCATTEVAMWSTVELGVGIIAASVVTLRPLLKLAMYRLGLSAQAPEIIRRRERHTQRLSVYARQIALRSDADGGRSRRPSHAGIRLADMSEDELAAYLREEDDDADNQMGDEDGSSAALHKSKAQEAAVPATPQ